MASKYTCSRCGTDFTSLPESLLCCLKANEDCFISEIIVPVENELEVNKLKTKINIRSKGLFDE